MPAETTSVRVPEQLAEWLRSRADRSLEPSSLGSQLVRAAGDLHIAMSGELRRITLTLKEAQILAAAAAGPMLSVGLGSGMLAVELADMVEGVADTYAAAIGFDSPADIAALVERLISSGPSADLALRDALSRWWDANLPATSEGFGAVGIRILGD